LLISEHKESIVPFLKWAGGKRWLVDRYAHYLDVEYQRFIEPFLGSGAVFFKLMPSSSILCDKNIQLIETYASIRDDWEQVERHLKDHHVKHSKEHYYQTRAKKFQSPYARAAQFIYLNRTCWNGLYRVNLSGSFNVPIGTKNNVIMPTDDFSYVSKLLSATELLAGDFELAISRAGIGDLVFVDPPYTVKHNYNGFVKYNESIFSWDDQLRLRDCVVAATSRGAKVIVTNACHDSIKDIYKGVGDIVTLSRSSVIGGTGAVRGKYEEVLIKCF